MRLLIQDADIITYLIGCVHENEGQWGIVRFNVDNFIREIFRYTNATHYNGFITDSSNCFRRRLTKEYNEKVNAGIPTQGLLGKLKIGAKPLINIKEYKSNRPDSRPKWYSQIRNYLQEHWKFQMVGEIEADDAVNITFLHHYLQESNPVYDVDDLIVCSTDKDFQQCAGIRIYNPTSKSFKNVTKEEAHYFTYWQLLRGDNTDGVDGIKGIGEQKAHSLLFGYPPYKFEEVVKLEYAYKYGKQGLELYEITKQLLQFRNSHEGFSIPIPIEIPQSVISQSPYGSFLSQNLED